MATKPVLAIPDLHEPFTQARFKTHCKKAYKDFGCGEVVLLGDVADQHAMSFHDHCPSGFGPGVELKLARKGIKKWYDEWPEAIVTVGNHDARIHRRAYRYGLPAEVVKSLGEIYQTPNWRYCLRHEIAGVLYTHGTKYSGMTAHKRIAERNRQSTVIGHVHSHAGVYYMACHKNLIFGLNAGCGIDCSAYAMDYAVEFDVKPTLGCGVVINKHEAYFVPMSLGEKA